MGRLMRTLFGLFVLAFTVIGCGLVPDPGGGGGGWKQIELPLGQDDNSVRAVFCSAANKCVIATDSNTGDPGAVFALSDTAVGEKLLDGKYMGEVSTKSNTLGDLDFVGFDPTRDGLIARVSDSSVITAATGDFTQKSSWTITNTGRTDGDTFGLNETCALQHDASNNFVFINRQGFVYSSTAAPAMTTTWKKVWSPTAVPPVPADFRAQKMADPSLCESDVSAGGLPSPSQPVYVAQDLSVIVTPAGGLNMHGTAPAGVCISTDRGAHFYSIAFANLPTEADNDHAGPLGVTCTDKDNCYAYNGVQFGKGSAYVYYTSNASAGKASTWTKATMPSGFATSDSVSIQGLFFAPDKAHGWAVGNDSHKALLLRTTDSGHTWTDVSASVRAVKENDLYNGFALDNDHVWLVGRFGTVLATSSAQQ